MPPPTTDASRESASAPHPDEFAETPADRDERSISLPAPPQELPRGPFPWLMMLTPAALGAGLVVMTGSTHALVFAALGPVMALGTVIDQSFQRRARHRRDDEQFESALVAAEHEVAARLGRERARRLGRHAPVRRVLDGRAPLVARDERGGGGVPVAFGLTTVPSGIRLDAAGADADRRLRALVDRAHVIDGIPLVVPVRRFAVVGPPSAAVAVALGIVVDIATRRPDGFDIAIHGGPARRPVIAELVRSRLVHEGVVRLGGDPRRQAPTDDRRTGDPASAAEGPIGEVVLAIVDDRSSLPGEVDVVLELGDGDAVVRTHSGATKVTPQSVHAEEFRDWARRFITERRRRGFGRRDSDGIPAEVDLDELLRVRPPAGIRIDGSGLATPIGVGIEGPVWIDLVGDGPHAVVGGTTGTGKSELLRAWIAGLAARYPATYVSFLCIDFKGGATFDAIAGLPHCVGLVTDLDGGEATRVLAGLRAELRHREHDLRRRGVRDIAELAPGTLARLVVVVDEFQALINEHHELHDAFTDLAARGRSLGIHLVLCAQRPAGAARESLLANCTIRLSLRVTNAADSHAVVGSGDAAGLPADQRGRALVAVGGSAREVQIARSCDGLLGSTLARRVAEIERSGSDLPRAPWLPPLPLTLTADEAGRLLGASDGARVPVALLDDPQRQRQPVFGFEVRGGAHLLIVGPSGCGKSTALAWISDAAERAGCAVERVPTDVERAWDAIARIRRRRARDPVVVVVDDLDQCAASFGDEHRHAWLASLADLARLGGSRRITFVWSTTRATGEIGQFLGLARHVLRLGSPSRHEFVLSGGETGEYRAALPPGRGVVRGMLAQVPLVTPPTAGSRAAGDRDADDQGPQLDLAGMGAVGAALVTRRPLERSAQLVAAGIVVAPVPRPGAVADTSAAPSGVPAAPSAVRVVTVGEPDVWQQSYGALGRMAARTAVIFDDVPPATIRSLIPGEPLPPPVADPSGVVLVRETGGEVRRFAWAPPGVEPVALHG